VFLPLAFSISFPVTQVYVMHSNYFSILLHLICATPFGSNVGTRTIVWAFPSATGALLPRSVGSHRNSNDIQWIAPTKNSADQKSLLSASKSFYSYERQTTATYLPRFRMSSSSALSDIGSPEQPSEGIDVAFDARLYKIRLSRATGIE
jgi:hypothetical protein